jgi:hypothetical protein
VVLLTFDAPLALPGGPALSIVNLRNSADVSRAFLYSIDPGRVTRKAKETGAVLVNQNCHRVTPAAGFHVQPFTLDLCKLEGDATPPNP